MATKVQVEVSYGHHSADSDAQGCWASGYGVNCNEFGNWNVKGRTGEFRSCGVHLAAILHAVNGADIQAEKVGLSIS